MSLNGLQIMSYNYVVTAQKPTAVNACVTGKYERFYCIVVTHIDTEQSRELS